MPQVGAPARLLVGYTSPADAVAAFHRRGLLQPSFRWHDVWQEEHARAFAVAGVARLDVLRAIRAALDESVADGSDFPAFKRRALAALVRAGLWGDVEITDPTTGETRMTRFDGARLRLIHDVNLRQSYAAGRWAAATRNARRKPLMVYRTMRDERVRASHRRWDGVALPMDHPFWRQHYPPNGWRCRCRAFPASERDVARMEADGLPVRREPPPDELRPWVNPTTGEIDAIPLGIDPGFAYNAGLARDATLQDQLVRKAVSAHPLAAATVVAQAQVDHAAMVARSTASFTAWVRELATTKRATQSLQFIGVIHPGAMRALRQMDRAPASAAIAVRDVDVLHALRDGKDAAVRVPQEIYERLPTLVTTPRAILEDRGAAEPTLLYAVDVDVGEGRVAKLVLRLDWTTRINRGARAPINIVRTATMMNARALRDPTAYRLLWGSI